MPAVIALSRRAGRLVVANLIIAATFIAGLVIWDLLGTYFLPPEQREQIVDQVVAVLRGHQLTTLRVECAMCTTPWSLIVLSPSSTGR